MEFYPSSKRALSSVGRASALQAECRRFDPCSAHHFSRSTLYLPLGALAHIARATLHLPLGAVSPARRSGPYCARDAASPAGRCISRSALWPIFPARGCISRSTLYLPLGALAHIARATLHLLLGALAHIFRSTLRPAEEIFPVASLVSGLLVISNNQFEDWSTLVSAGIDGATSFYRLCFESSIELLNNRSV